MISSRRSSNFSQVKYKIQTLDMIVKFIVRIQQSNDSECYNKKLLSTDLGGILY